MAGGGYDRKPAARARRSAQDAVILSLAWTHTSRLARCAGMQIRLLVAPYGYLSL